MRERWTNTGWLVAAVVVAAASCQKTNPNFIGPTSTTAGDGGTTTTGPSSPTSDSQGPATTNDDDTADSTGVATCTPDLEGLRAFLFQPKCAGAGCHEGEMAAASLDLMAADLFVDLLDVPSATCQGWTRLVAETPDLSMLYARVTGIATCTADKPVEHQPLTGEERDCLAAFIEAVEDCERCGGTSCIDPLTHSGHCGGCGIGCPTDIDCVGGSCDCPAGTTACGDVCTDTMTDPLNCGGCDNDCAGGACVDGTCDCAATELNCGACVDPMTNDLHCGGCDQPCPLGQTCQAGTCACSDDPLSFAGDVQPIFNDNCVANNCHGGSMPKKDLDLQSGASYAHLVSVMAVECNDGRFRVAPGDPDNSYLMHKVLGVDMCSGVQMPQSGGPGGGLADTDLGTMYAWICQGAPDN